MTTTTLTKKDFTSDQEVRWCPGCGDYAILSAVQKTMPELGVPKENVVFVSGIGCSSRFPYYMNTYGFHTIHGRGPAIATGLKIARPDLSVWVATGDGDALSIGGNHLIHALRRNVNIKILLFNNEIYGLTKGQYSPTSAQGTIAKSTPYGSLDHPFIPASLAVGAEASFIARMHDKDMKLMSDIIVEAHKHRGAAFVEILQNCVIFNDNVFEPTIGKEVKDDNTILLQHGQPLVFGKNKEKGIRFNGFTPEVVTISDVGMDEIHIHNIHEPDPTYALAIARMANPTHPLAMGVIRSVERAIYEEQIEIQNQEFTARKGMGQLDSLLRTGDVWEIK